VRISSKKTAGGYTEEEQNRINAKEKNQKRRGYM
jgi:hypothetical protein